MLRVLFRQRPVLLSTYIHGPSVYCIRAESASAFPEPGLSAPQIRSRQNYISRNRNNDRFSRDRVQDAPVTDKVRFKDKKGALDADDFKSADPDSFGTLSMGRAGNVVDEVSQGVSDEIRAITEQHQSIYAERETDDQVFRPDERWSMPKLRKKIVELLEQRKLTQALDTFFEVIQDGGFQFDTDELSYLHNILICECGKAGFVQQAYQLFTIMKKRGYRVKPATYTSLFNACANSLHEREANLQRIERLRLNMEERGFAPNIMHYHAMIKAYGRLGAIESAFSVVDDMISPSNPEKIYLTSQTFNFLLQACITDRENGFRHAILTWTKMNDMRIRPDLFSYNLLLRVIRECGIVLPSAKSKRTAKYASDSRKQGQAQRLSNEEEHFGMDMNADASRPLLLAPSASSSVTQNMAMLDMICSQKDEAEGKGRSQALIPSMRSNEDIMASLTTPENRLAVLGGLRAFTMQLERDRIKPNLKTVTELVQVVVPNEISDVMMLMDHNGLKPDIDFFNMVMKRLMTFREVDRAREIVRSLGSYHLTPNVMTWGILATGCHLWGDAAGLLREMDAVGIEPNSVIMGAFVHNACKAFDPRFVLRVMEEQLRREIQPNQVFVDMVTRFKTQVERAVVDQECGREVNPPRLGDIIQTDFFREYWGKFKLRFDRWKHEINVLPEDENPWKDDYYARIERLKQRKHELK